jgi:hypothetical protein
LRGSAEPSLAASHQPRKDTTMTDGPPRRWDDDSSEEDAEVHRARELARLQRWMAEHGMLPGDAAESLAGPVTLPDWWHDVAEPGDCCPWCQQPGVPSPCAECRTARETGGDPAALWAWWASLAPAQRWRTLKGKAVKLRVG